MTKKPKTYKTTPPNHDEVSEPAIVYGELNVLKQQVIEYINQLNDPEILQRLKKYINRQKKKEAEETICKEEILSGIEEGLKAIREEQEGKKSRFRDISKLLDEL